MQANQQVPRIFSPFTRRAAAAVAAATLLVGTVSAAPPSDADNIKHAIEERFPGSHVEKVQPAAIPGLYEVFTGSELLYTDSRGDYLLMGPMVDTKTHQNLTSARLSDLNRVNFDTLPVNQAIKVVKGTGARHFAVFSDPDCPYCQALEKTLLSVNDFTMYVFLYPIASLHPQATAKAHSIWCAKDHTQAWSQWMHEKKLPPTVASCPGDPVESLQKLGNQLHVNSTPTLLFASGRRVSGAIPQNELEQELSTAAAAAAKH